MLVGLLVAVVLLDDLVEQVSESSIRIVRASIQTNAGVEVLDAREDARLERHTARILLVLVLLPNVLGEVLREQRLGAWREELLPVLQIVRGLGNVGSPDLLLLLSRSSLLFDWCCWRRNRSLLLSLSRCRRLFLLLLDRLRLVLHLGHGLHLLRRGSSLVHRRRGSTSSRLLGHRTRRLELANILTLIGSLSNLRASLSAARIMRPHARQALREEQLYKNKCNRSV